MNAHEDVSQTGNAGAAGGGFWDFKLVNAARSMTWSFSPLGPRGKARGKFRSECEAPNESSD
jgi:hypothetical protein